MKRHPALAVALLPVLAGSVYALNGSDQYQPLRYPAFECSVAAMASGGAKEIPVVKGGRAKDFPEMSALGADVAEYWEAYRQAYEGYLRAMKQFRGHCPRGDDFVELMALHKDAVDRRVKEMVGHFPADMVGQASVEEFQKLGLAKERPADASGLRAACRRPDPPPKLKSPVVPAGASPAAAKILGELRESTAEFHASQTAVHAAHVRLMDLGEAINCRELHVSYQSHIRRFYEAFYARRESDLARIMDASLTWEQIP